MPISLNPKHLKRYGQIARMLVKYGRSDLVKSAGLEDTLKEVEAPSANGGAAAETRAEATAEGGQLADDLEAMGPTYVKLGQLLSTRADFLPPTYMASLARLQDDLEPFPFAEVEEIVTSELGVRLSKAFNSFEPEPIAAASLGQVHRATLRNGRPVAVKVQRPGIREQIACDLEALADIAEFLDAHTDAGRRFDFGGMLDEFRKSLLRELDYLQEANHLAIFAHNLREFDRIVVPEAVADYTTSRVLTMDYIRGRKITELSPLARMEMDGEELAETLFRAYLKQILVDGIFHADPHPGNLFLTNDGHIALLDLGMIGRIAPVMQEHLLKLLLAISEGKGEQASQIAIRMGQPLDDFDEKRYVREVSQLVAQHQDKTVENIETGRVVLEITRTAGMNGIRLPAELTLLGKTLLNLDLVARTLAPDFNPNEAVRRNASEVLRQRLTKSISPANMFSTVLELNEFVQTLPSRLNRVLDRVAQNELSLKVDAIDENELIGGMQKIANRITLGLILA
ncbi:MAG TPA: AarF/ABC1/UbiB kinase family protein, partial [Longimicrobiales bacterium]|nr:AarF/ABC1/UbiB kinase family protein [Longimicrobiales bacterium]